MRTPLKRLWIVLLAFLAGALLLARTPDLPADALIAKYAPPPSKFMTLPSGARVHYRDEGPRTAPILLLLHGSNSSLHTWEPWVRLLSDKMRVVTVDFPGHGLTGPVPGDDYSVNGLMAFVEAFRGALGIDHFALAGNSMGGNVSWRYTLAHPGAVDKLVLVDAAGLNHLLPPEHQPHVPIGMRIARTPVINLIAGVVTPRNVVEKTTRAIFVDQTRVTDTMIDRYYELLLYPGNRRATRLRAAADPDTARAEHLGEIKAPTLILSGQRDPLTPVESARMFHARITGSRLLEYPDVGHVPMEEIPERSAADVRAFLAEGSEARQTP